MSVAAPSLVGMNRAEQLRLAERRAILAGVVVREADLPEGMWGHYSRPLGVISISRELSTSARLATLLHELAHHERGDDRCQSPEVEARINEDVARALISPAEYALAERLHEGRTGAIALELDLPRWVVSAYRAPLWRGEGVRRDEEVSERCSSLDGGKLGCRVWG